MSIRKSLGKLTVTETFTETLETKDGEMVDVSLRSPTVAAMRELFGGTRDNVDLVSHTLSCVRACLDYDEDEEPLNEEELMQVVWNFGGFVDKNPLLHVCSKLCGLRSEAKDDDRPTTASPESGD